MAGITASSASKVLLAGSTSADKSLGGFAVGEMVTLATSPTGTEYQWGQAFPAGSSQARAAISATTGASVTFVPDVAGVHTITCLVDDVTSYTLRLTVTSTAISQLAEAIRQTPKADATVPAPAVGLMVFFSDTFSQWAVKDPSDRIWPLLTGAMGAALTDANATIQIGDGGRRVLPDATLTDNRTVTLGTTSAVAGDIIELVRLDTEAFTLAVVNGGPGAGTLLTYAVSAALYGCFKFDGTNWALDRRRALS
jgi:hypothetical protein